MVIAGELHMAELTELPAPALFHAPFGDSQYSLFGFLKGN